MCNNSPEFKYNSNRLTRLEQSKMFTNHRINVKNYKIKTNKTKHLIQQICIQGKKIITEKQIIKFFNILTKILNS